MQLDPKPSSMGAGDRAFRLLAAGAAAVLPLLLAALAIQLLLASRIAWERFGLAFLIHRVWNPVAEEFGALPFLFGTLVTTALSMAIAGPAGIAIAIYLAEMAPPSLRLPLGILIELLAAVPSVVYGLWGIFVLIPWLRSHVEAPLAARAGFIPLFAGPVYGPGLLAAGVLLAIMVLPTVAAISRDVLLAIPGEQRDAALALGVTRWEMIRHVLLPTARSGIWGAIGLGLGRAMGETIAATMVIGNTPQIRASLFATGYSLPAVIANEFTEAASPGYQSALMAVGLVLFALTLTVGAFGRLKLRGMHR